MSPNLSVRLNDVLSDASERFFVAFKGQKRFTVNLQVWGRQNLPQLFTVQTLLARIRQRIEQTLQAVCRLTAFGKQNEFDAVTSANCFQRWQVFVKGADEHQGIAVASQLAFSPPSGQHANCRFNFLFLARRCDANNAVSLLRHFAFFLPSEGVADDGAKFVGQPINLNWANFSPVRFEQVDEVLSVSVGGFVLRRSWDEKLDGFDAAVLQGSQKLPP